MMLVERGASTFVTSLRMIAIFLRLLTMEFLTQVGLIPARVAVELVDAPLEAGMALRSASPCIFVTTFQANSSLFFRRYDEFSAVARSPSTS